MLLTSKGLKLSPVAFLYYVAPLCAATLLIPWLATELPSLSHHHFRAVRRTGPLTLLANASVAFLLNLVRPRSWRESGALLLCCCCVVLLCVSIGGGGPDDREACGFRQAALCFAPAFFLGLCLASLGGHACVLYLLLAGPLIRRPETRERPPSAET